MRAALLNPAREKFRLVLTPNSAVKLVSAVRQAGIEAEIADTRRLPAPLDPGSVHQGAALEVLPLSWPALGDLCAGQGETARIVVLDRVSDPHNAGAVIRSAAAFGAIAMLAPLRHSPPETGTMAKSASGALETLPYVRVSNLAAALGQLRRESFSLLGFAADGNVTVDSLPKIVRSGRQALVLGSEGEGLRRLTREKCDFICRLCDGSLNLSNAASVALYATSIDN